MRHPGAEEDYNATPLTSFRERRSLRMQHRCWKVMKRMRIWPLLPLHAFGFSEDDSLPDTDPAQDFRNVLDHGSNLIREKIKAIARDYIAESTWSEYS